MSENHERTKNEPISSESLEFFNQFYEFLLSDPDDATFRISLGTAFQIPRQVVTRTRRWVENYLASTVQNMSLVISP